MINKNNKNTELAADAPKAKKAVRFGILDAFIILLVIAIVVGVFLRFNFSDMITKAQNRKDYAITFSIKNIRHTTDEYFNVGDSVYFESDDELFGTLMTYSDLSKFALDKRPSSKVFNENGEIIEVSYPNTETRIDVTGRIKCEGTLSESGFLLNNSTYIAPGQTINIYTRLVSVTITVLEITEITSQ